jgi:hypothetical protein
MPRGASRRPPACAAGRSRGCGRAGRPAPVRAAGIGRPCRVPLARSTRVRCGSSLQEVSMQSPPGTLGLVALPGLRLAGTSIPTRVPSAWCDSGCTSEPMKRILVVGVAGRAFRLRQARRDAVLRLPGRRVPAPLVRVLHPAAQHAAPPSRARQHPSSSSTGCIVSRRARCPVAEPQLTRLLAGPKGETHCDESTLVLRWARGRARVATRAPAKRNRNRNCRAGIAAAGPPG